MTTYTAIAPPTYGADLVDPEDFASIVDHLNMCLRQLVDVPAGRYASADAWRDQVETGPGIAALDFTEPLAWLDTDLLCADE